MDFAVAKNNSTVDLVPLETSESQLVATGCGGVSVRWLALSVVVPCVYIFRGKPKHLVQPQKWLCPGGLGSPFLLHPESQTSLFNNIQGGFIQICCPRGNYYLVIRPGVCLYNGKVQYVEHS